MLEFLPLPGWDGLHPLIVHFPIALLIVAPLLVVVALIWRRHARALMIAALIVMALGTAAGYLAVSTGEAAGKLADRTPQVNLVLAHHEDLAERTRLIFTILTLVFAGLIAAPQLLRREPSRASSAILTLLFLAAYGAGTLVLSSTAHNGGRLVHELGVHAMLPPAPPPAANAAAIPGD